MLEKNLCFVINKEKLYLDFVLVDYEHVPIFFVCTSIGGYYIALCTNIEELNYIVVKLSRFDLYKILSGLIPMRDVILKQPDYFEIQTSENMIEDRIIHKSMNMINKADLPEAGAYFEALTPEQKEYVSSKISELIASIAFTTKRKVYVQYRYQWCEQPKYSRDKNKYPIVMLKRSEGALI